VVRPGQKIEEKVWHELALENGEEELPERGEGKMVYK
jgi:hypothetical protein